MNIFEDFNIELHTMEPLTWMLDHLLCWVERHDGFLLCTSCNQVFWDGVQKKEGEKVEELCRDLRRHVSVLLSIEVGETIAPVPLVVERLGQGQHRIGGGEL